MESTDGTFKAHMIKHTAHQLLKDFCSGAWSGIRGSELPSTVAGEGAQSTAGAVVRPLGHHAVDAMQSMLSFRQDVYPTTYATPALTGRALLNGNTVAAIPSAVFRPL